jgi:phosphatidylinositol-3-phosphatase
MNVVISSSVASRAAEPPRGFIALSGNVNYLPNRGARATAKHWCGIALLRKLVLVCIATLSYIFSLNVPAEATSVIKHVIVIAMENTDKKQLYGNNESAPYINNYIIPNYSRADNFDDPLPIEIPSEPHYVWMEAGTNKLSDHTFLTDHDPSVRNRTGSGDHLVTQIGNSKRLSWKTYQEDIGPATGQCPIVSAFPYAAKHNPFVFFQDISGNPPKKDSEFCKDHTKPYSDFSRDLSVGKMANYVFITPNLCNDMHGDARCPKVRRVLAGDRWLSAELPRIIDWVNGNSGVIFIIWDEGSSTRKLPFLAIGPGVKSNYASSARYNHGSLLKSVEEIFELPILTVVSRENDFNDMFRPGLFP